MKKYTLVLASRSPRRHKLLGWLNIPFDTIGADIDESFTHPVPSEVATELAYQKGHLVMKRLSKREDFKHSFFPVVVSADTIVVIGSEILGKPANNEDAKVMLLKLSGKEHKVITGVYIALYDRDSGEYREKKFYVETFVTFDGISDDLMNDYLKSEEGLDKAGAYGIQGRSLAFISSVKGSYSNVVGFPLSEFLKELKTLVNVKGSLRNVF